MDQPLMPEDPYAYLMATYNSPGYVPESDPEEEPKEDDEDPEEDLADYPVNRDDDDKEQTRWGYLSDDHPYHFSLGNEGRDGFLALTTPPPSPLTPLSSSLPQIPSPPPNSPTHIEISESCLPLRKRVRCIPPPLDREVSGRDVMSLRTTVVAQSALISELQSADHKRQRVISELLASYPQDEGNALTWWNSHVMTTTPEAAHAMPYKTLKKMMTKKYCPRGEIKKLEFEMWNLKRRINDV
ncbi:hypothetical protein Tco_1345880 [Tanacetum coccineum]